jgi:hypothetical protein
MAIDEGDFGADAVVQDVFGTSFGWFAVGTERSNGGQNLDAAIWRSEDGVAWQRVLRDPGDPKAYSGLGVTAITPGGPGLVAIGWVQGIEASPIWTSIDGLTWTRMDYDRTFFRSRIAGVLADSSGVFAWGSEDGEFSSWESPDGTEWRREGPWTLLVGGDRFFAPEGVAILGDLTVAVGYRSEDFGDDAVVMFWDRSTD